jgi:hypothetical protein
MIASDSMVEKLCREIYRETGEFYDRVRPRPGDKSFGYKILYGPPLVHAPIAFVGLNPGGVKSGKILGFRSFGLRHLSASRKDVRLTPGEMNKIQDYMHSNTRA